MDRFDKFDAQRKSATKMNGHTTAVENSLPVTPGSSGHVSPPAPEGSKEQMELEELSNHKTTIPLKKHKHESEDDDLSDVKDSPPPKKKKKVDHDSDAAYAAKLQALENSRMRSTRGGGPKSTPAKKKKTPKKKTSAKVKAEDDSDLDGSGSEVKEKKINRNGGFHVWLHPLV